MSKRIFDKIAAGLEDAIVYQAGDKIRAQEYRAKDSRVVPSRTGKNLNLV